MTTRAAKIAQALGHLEAARRELRQSYECAEQAGIPSIRDAIRVAGKRVAAAIKGLEAVTAPKNSARLRK